VVCHCAWQQFSNAGANKAQLALASVFQTLKNFRPTKIAGFDRVLQDEGKTAAIFAGAGF
jgi:hypothetical protein